MSAGPRQRSSVSVIVPCLNERATIGGLLSALRIQTYRGFDVVVADGMSRDGTRSFLEDHAREHPDLPLRVVENTVRSIPSGLNAAVREASGEILIRLDAHSKPADDYVERCLAVLEETHAANAGGQWVIQPGADSWIARGIAAAVADLLGAGDARYRVGGAAGPVDTVPFGAFRREWLERVGGFDETLETNEDYELNWRIRQAGGLVWFDPRIRCVYYARSRLRDLARQYWRYGWWKARMILRHPGSLRPRQIIPPGFVLGLIALLALSPFHPAAAMSLFLVCGIYLLVLIGRGMLLAIRRSDAALIGGVPLALVVIHFSWGTAALAGLAGLPRHRKGRGTN